ncbi:MAG: adenosylcobinamide-GDP ribazoletransferase [Deltaproteobacteria bacterium]|nr:adenosylcobinamide-GDP ribazoletransferase [Deltaproteobacteria bacterium]
MFGPIVTAFRTLTIIPIPGNETDEFPLSILGFPLVGLFLGGVIWLFHYFMQFWITPAIPIFVLLALAVESFFTGALHLDGLGDCADAFPGKRDQKLILELLKDSRMGTFGVCAIVFDLLLKFLLWSFLFERAQISIIVISLVLSRTMQGCLLVTMPNARKGGIASAFAGNHFLRHKLLATLILGVVGVLSIIFSSNNVVAVTSLLSALLITLLWALYCRKKIGGITGDCLGALNEFVELAVLLSGGMISGF